MSENGARAATVNGDPHPADAKHDKQSRGWRQLVIRIAGVVALLAVIVTGVLLAAGNHSETPNEQPRPEIQRTNVVVAPARQTVFERALTVQGNVRAKNRAMISPRADGVLNEIMVDEGDAVEAGVTHLFQSDSVKLTKTVEVRRHEVNVAEQSLREKQASFEKNQADFDKADYDRNRYRDLHEKNISSNDELEEAETEFRRCAAMLKHADALVDLADAQLEQSRSALAIAQKDLDDSLIIAPISGRVAERFQEPGEMGSLGQPVLRIEDPSLVEVCVFLPAQAYGEVLPGETEMQVTISGVNLGQRVVSYKSPTIDTRFRTFETRCLLENPPETAAPGAMAHVRVVLERRPGLGVPRDAIQHRAGTTVVFIADGDTARMIPVAVGLEMDGLVEVVSEQLDETVQIVAVGGYFLDPDAPIKIVPEKP